MCHNELMCHNIISLVGLFCQFNTSPRYPDRNSYGGLDNNASPLDLYPTQLHYSKLSIRCQLALLLIEC